MTRYRILGGPDEDGLMTALQRRRRCHSIYLMLLEAGATRSQRHFFFVDGLRYAIAQADVWEVRLSRTGSMGEVLTGFYCTANRRGELGSEGTDVNPPISLLGLDYQVEGMLHQATIHRVAELVCLDEFQACQVLLGDLNGFPITNEDVAAAIRRFELLRVRMDVNGLRFSGNRRTLEELYQSF